MQGKVQEIIKELNRAEYKDQIPSDRMENFLKYHCCSVPNAKIKLIEVIDTKPNNFNNYIGQEFQLSHSSSGSPLFMNNASGCHYIDGTSHQELIFEVV